MTGADAVFVYSHTVRTEDTSGFNVAYARFVHCDYSLGGAAGRRESALAKHKADLDPARRWEFAWYNTWQPIERRRSSIDASASSSARACRPTR